MSAANEESSLNALVMRCRDIIECDTARITTPCGKMFLVIGFNRNTKDDKHGYWKNENGERIDFDYVHEVTVASGETEEELLASLREYKRICGLTMEEYLKEKIPA
ncbi:MAG: hypothetical protein AB2723_17515 [Candidatus Thiodiazotropha sp.]